MRGLRFLAAGLVIATALATQTPVRAAHAGSASASIKTDFTQVTPENAIVYAAIQSTSARQTRLLSSMGGQLGTVATPLLQTVLGQVLGSNATTSGLTSGSIQQVTTLLGGALGRIFNGELGLSVLPLTLTPGQGTAIPTPHLHLLLDAGLQPGITQGTLLFSIQALGLTTGARTSYHGVSVVSVDLNVLARSLGGMTKNGTMAGGTLIPANGPISNMIYATVLGNDAVLASDMPTLAAAIDTFSHAQPSIAASDAFAEATGILPTDRFATLYLHLGGATLGQILQSLGASISILPAAVNDAGSGTALGLTAETHALLLTTATPPGLQATVLAIPGL